MSTRFAARYRVRAAAVLLVAPSLGATPPAPARAATDCPRCAQWTVPHKPFRIYGNTYYVGTNALSAILVTSSAGDILIDGTVQEGAAQVAANIRALGFRVQDVRLILNSHAHFDHAGGLWTLQQLSGAQVAAGAWSARVLRLGHSLPDDPQYASLARGPTALGAVRVISDGQTLTVGDLKVTAHFTPGHTPGGTSWTWRSCEQARCLSIVYADSLSAIGAPGFSFDHSGSYPTILADFQHSFAVLDTLPCDILLTPHPEVSDTFGRLARRDSGAAADAFADPNACREYVAGARTDLARRLADAPPVP